MKKLGQSAVLWSFSGDPKNPVDDPYGYKAKRSSQGDSIANMMWERMQSDTIIRTEYAQRKAANGEAIGLGITLQEEKDISYGIQQAMTSMQVKDFINEQRICSECGKKRTIDSYHNLNYRTLFGKLILKSPRLNECVFKTSKRISFSPLPLLLAERTSPELSYL